MDRNLKGGLLAGAGAVALRKESVDRNRAWKYTGNALIRSLSARRAWIEISVYLGYMKRKSGRSPQGERG